MYVEIRIRKKLKLYIFINHTHLLSKDTLIVDIVIHLCTSFKSSFFITIVSAPTAPTIACAIAPTDFVSDSARTHRTGAVSSATAAR